MDAVQRFQIVNGEVVGVFGVPVRTDSGIPSAYLRKFGNRIRRLPGPWCWEWTAGTDGKNYGAFWTPFGKAAHRFSFLAFNGEIPSRQHVHHECSNTRCVNPAHLKVVTPREHVLNHTPKAITAISAARTHCLRGHELSGYNLITGASDGKRHCRQCKNDWTNRKRAAAPKPVKPQKTHCDHGHEWIPENLYQQPNGSWSCSVCRKERAKAFRERAKLLGEPYVPVPWDQRPPQTHCVNGHEITPEATRREPNGRLRCITCQKEQWQAYKAKRRTEARSSQ